MKFQFVIKTQEHPFKRNLTSLVPVTWCGQWIPIFKFLSSSLSQLSFLTTRWSELRLNWSQSSECGIQISISSKQNAL